MGWSIIPAVAHLISHSKPGDPVWLIEMSIANSTYSKIKRNQKSVSFTPDSCIFNGKPMEIMEMHSRGKTTLHFWRKSYTVELKDQIEFEGPDERLNFDHFYLISMSLDRNYYHNRLAFQSLSLLGLFPLYYHYVEVRINGLSEGLYLLVQRPADYALDDLGSPGILRRGSTDFVTKEKFKKSTSKENRLECKRVFKEIKSTGKRSGVDLYQYLNERIDLDAYFSWLAFNYLVRNGDYTDEIFYYILPDEPSTRFGIIPWDFDDILVKDPHEGREMRDRQLDDQLIFSSEDKLDRMIARDPYLYRQYLIQFSKVLEVLNVRKISDIFNEIEEELTPYFQTSSIIDVSQHDFKPVESWKALQDNLITNLTYIETRISLVQLLIKQYQSQ
ncbi:MAG: CotH kinase family protein [Saprospiraceae bacterium]|nr:CotH kinase family protein [Saprospiraceae bacterium]